LSLTPIQFADAVRDQFFQPAVDELAGRDNRLQLSEAGRAPQLPGQLSLVGSELDRYFQTTGYQSSSKSRVVQAIHTRALESAQAAIEADGTVRDPSKLPAELRPIFLALAPAELPANLEYSPRVLQRVMDAYGISDRDALIAEAYRRHNNNDLYLTRAELEAAAKVLTGEARELGIISDLDKTIIPPHRNELPAEAYPGVAQLFAEIEDLDGDRADTTYVTARNGPRLEGLAEWLAAHGLPAGPIEGGISTIPAVAEREKIADIAREMEAHPGKRYVLFGDSNHRDPEVYRAIRERFGDRVIAAFIQKVTETVAPSRVEGLHLIDNYAEAASVLLDLRVLDRDAARRVMVAAQLGGLDITDAEIQALLGER
jgi:hypothetical protein